MCSISTPKTRNFVAVAVLSETKNENKISDPFFCGTHFVVNMYSHTYIIKLHICFTCYHVLLARALYWQKSDDTMYCDAIYCKLKNNLILGKLSWFKTQHHMYKKSTVFH